MRDSHAEEAKVTYTRISWKCVLPFLSTGERALCTLDLRISAPLGGVSLTLAPITYRARTAYCNVSAKLVHVA